jgi:hypothetical protein
MLGVTHRESAADDAELDATHRQISLESVILLAFAIALGAWFRFAHLGASELDGDEAVSWRAASASTLAEVARLHEKMNRGKLPIYSIALHLWLKLFGQSEAALRGLSATLGTLAIALVWFAVYEAVRAPSMRTPEAGVNPIDASVAAGLCALITAASLVMIRYSREARMYPLMLTMTLAQVGFLMRAARRGGLANYAATAIFTALAIAVNFTALLAVAAEFAWLAWIFYGRPRGTSSAAVWRLGAALAIGGLLLAPFARGIGLLEQGVSSGMLEWISPPRVVDLIRTYESTNGGWVFAFLAILSVWGCVSLWQSRQDLLMFGLLWMWLPPILTLVGSYLFFPMNPPRYSLSSFIGFFMLASVALASIRNLRMRYALTGALLLLMIGRVNYYNTKPRDSQFREAAALALKVAPGAGKVGVASYESSFSSTLYYFSQLDRSDLIELPPSGPIPAAVSQIGAIILPDDMPAADLARYRALFPQLEGRFRKVEVRSR